MTLTRIFSIILIFILFSCGSDNTGPIKEKSEPVDSLKSIDTVSAAGDYTTFEPYTENPIYLVNDKIYIDSLLPYFKYKNIERLDILSTNIENWTLDSLMEIVFSNKKIKFPHKKDTVYLSDYQFIIGNVKTNGENSILAIIDYYESWGHEIKLLTVNKGHEIIDAQSLSASYADGGDFYISTLNI